jgi:hypothetical protein
MLDVVNGLSSSLLTRRRFTLGAALAAAGLAAPRFVTAAAQDATPDLASLGLPTLDVTITADGFEGVPDTLTAGRYLLNATAEALPEGGTLSFLQPYGMSAEEFFAAFSGGPPAEATPAADSGQGGEGEGEGGGEGEEGPLPTFVYQSKFAGGVFAAPGMPGTAVIDLTEGEWIAWGDDPEASQMPVVVTITGEFPADAPEPEADIMATLVDFGITIEGNLTAGEHLLRVENLGAQPHFVEIGGVPAGTTNEDITALFESFMTGTPAASGLSEEDLTEGAFTPTQSIGTVTWTKLTLAAGTYAAMCFFPTAGTGEPHAFHGMHTVFEVQ